MVVSSFVISGMSAVVKATEVHPGRIAAGALIGTVAGCAGVLTTYMGWPQRPDEEYRDTIIFDPEQSKIKVWFYFIISLLAFVGYAAAPAEEWGLALLFDVVAIYTFFRALVTAFLANRRIEAQHALWEKIEPDGREHWFQVRLEEVEQRQESERITKEIEEAIARTERATEDIDTTLKKHRREELQRRMTSILGRIHRWSIDLRLKIGDDRLLTRKEKTRRELEKLKTQAVIKEFNARFNQEIYQDITRGSIPALIDEASGLTFFKKGVGFYLVVAESWSEERTRDTLNKLVSVADPDGNLKRLTILLEPDAALTIQAERIIESAGARLYWTRPPNKELNTNSN